MMGFVDTSLYDSCGGRSLRSAPRPGLPTVAPGALAGLLVGVEMM